MAVFVFASDFDARDGLLRIVEELAHFLIAFVSCASTPLRLRLLDPDPRSISLLEAGMAERLFLAEGLAFGAETGCVLVMWAEARDAKSIHFLANACSSLVDMS